MKIRNLIAAASLAALCAGAWAQEHIIRFGHVSQPTHPTSFGVQKFGEILAAKSGGKIKVQEFGAAVLGSEAQLLSAVQGGTLDMTIPSTPSMGSLVKEFTLLDLPFSFSKAEQVDALLAGPFGQLLMDKLPPKGLVGLAFTETGFRNFTNSRKPIVSVDDLKGLKLRVMGNPMFVESFAALGTNPVPMAFPELYGALESKAMDAQENPYTAVLAGRFYEVQKYMSVTNHSYTANVMIIGRKTWDKFSPAEQKMVREAALESAAFQRRVSRAAEAGARKELEARMQVNDVPAATLARMRELTKPVADKFAATYDPAAVQVYRTEIEKVRATVH